MVNWKKEEINDLIKTLQKVTDIVSALKIHNLKWKKKRTKDSANSALKRNGKKSLSYYLKKETFHLNIEDDNLISRLLSLTKNKNKTMFDLCNILNISPKKLFELVEIVKGNGYNIKVIDKNSILLDTTAYPLRNKNISFKTSKIKNKFKIAFCGDLHNGSTLAKHKEFIDYVNVCYETGVRDIVVAGDITAGINMYRGQNNELISWAGSEQVKIALDSMPQKKDLRYYILGGNHDESFLKVSGLDALKLLESRGDFKLCGYYSSVITVNNIRIGVYHPEFVFSNAFPAMFQKSIDAIPLNQRPQICLIGHTHQSAFFPYYNGTCMLYAGCFEGQSLFLKRKNIQPSIGGWILEIGVTPDNLIRTVNPKFIYYVAGERIDCTFN